MFYKLIGEYIRYLTDSYDYTRGAQKYEISKFHYQKHIHFKVFNKHYPKPVILASVKKITQSTVIYFMCYLFITS